MLFEDYAYIRASLLSFLAFSVFLLTFVEGLGPKRQSQLYSVVLELFLCYSISIR